MKHERQRGEQLQGLYRLAQQVLPLALSPESIKYYASLVMYYSVYRLKRLDVWLRLLYLFVFVYHRYQRVHDHMLDSLIHHVRQYTDAAQAAAKDRVYTAARRQRAPRQSRACPQTVHRRVYCTQTPFQDVQATAFGILERQKLEMIADQITTRGRFDETAFQWDHLDGLAPQFRASPTCPAGCRFRRCRPHDPFLEAVQFQTVLRQGRSLRQQSAATFPLAGSPSK